MTFELGRRLLLSGAIQSGELRHAVCESARRRKPFLHALADASATARQLLNPAGAAIVPHADVAARLPPGLLAWLSAVPIAEDARSGTVDLAVVDDQDTFPALEVGFHLRAPVRLVRRSLESIERALDALGTTSQPLTDRSWVAPRTVRFEPSPPPSQPMVDEAALPLVRRARGSLVPISAEATPLVRPQAPEMPQEPREPGEPPEARASALPPETPRMIREPAVAMVLDFGQSARAERREAPSSPARPPSTAPVGPQPKRGPYAPLAPHVTAIERVMARRPLVEALVAGLATVAHVVVVLGVRRGELLGVGAGGLLVPAKVDGRVLPMIGAVAACLEHPESKRVGLLDFSLDAELLDVLELRAAPTTPVLLQAISVSDKPAMVLVAGLTGDLEECGRRAFALAEAGGRALVRILRRS